MRYLTPTLLIGTGAFVLWYNGSHGQSVIMLPFLSAIFPSLGTDPAAQGDVTAVLFFVLGGIFLVSAIVAQLRARRDRADQS